MRIIVKKEDERDKKLKRLSFPAAIILKLIMIIINFVAWAVTKINPVKTLNRVLNCDYND